MKIQSYVVPTDIEEAYQLLQEPSTTIIAGGAWLRLISKSYATAIDLSRLDLGQINETEENFIIGSMVTLRQLEVNSGIKKLLNGVIPEAIRQIMGVPIRNIATVGGTVCGRFGFSDLLTPLLALKATLVFYKKGQVTLESYLEHSPEDQDILLQVIIKKEEGKACYTTVKKTSNDFPIINVSVMKIGSHYRIAVGSRPSTARLAKKTMAFLNDQKVITDHIIEEAGSMAIEEITLGKNSRGSKEYRTQLCKVLVQRGIKEVQYDNAD